MPGADKVLLLGFSASFDPMAALTDTPDGLSLALGGGSSVLFQGIADGELSAGDFLLG